MKKTLYILAAIMFLMPSMSQTRSKDVDAQKFIEGVVVKIMPVNTESNMAYWKATTTGDKAWYKKYEETEIEYRNILSDKKLFEESKSLHKSKIDDPLIKRQIEIIYLSSLENQIDPKLNEELVRQASGLEKKFNAYRAKIGNKEVTDNDIRQIMKKTRDIKKRKQAWEASKQIGKVVADDLIALVKKRNEAARDIGFKNYYVMELKLQEQNEREIFGILNRLAAATERPYKKLKIGIDDAVAKQFNIKPNEVAIWHYEDTFFQEAPKSYSVD